MDAYEGVRRFEMIEGDSRREAARVVGFCVRRWTRVRRSPRRRARLSSPRPKPKLACFWGVLDAMVAADANAPLKQRHAHQGALRDEYGYSGGYDQVREAVRERRQRLKEAFVSLAHRLANCPPDRIDEVARWFETQGVVPIVG